MMVSLCKGCDKSYKARSQTPNQKYCSTKECQRIRKRRWQNSKRRVDLAYRTNDSEGQGSWRKNNPGYFKEYRHQNPEYEARNRQQQRQRDQARREKRLASRTSLAKVDASMLQHPDNTSVIPSPRRDLAKVDASKVQYTGNTRVIRFVPCAQDLANVDMRIPEVLLRITS